MDEKSERERIISRIISWLPLIDTITYEQKQRLEEDIKYVFDNTPQDEKESLDKLKRALEEYKKVTELKEDNDPLFGVNEIGFGYTGSFGFNYPDIVSKNDDGNMEHDLTTTTEHSGRNK